MLVCNKCKNPLQIRTNHIVLSNFYVSFKGVTLTELEIIQPETLETSYYCPHCDEQLAIVELETKCYLCSRYVPILEAVVVKGRGNYHRACAEEFFKGEPTESLVKLLEKGVNKNE